MGLVCSLYRATAADIERLIATPDALDAFLEEIDGPPIPVREVRPKGILGLLLRLTPVRITEVDPDAIRDRSLEEMRPDPERTIEIDKAWHGLHYLLTGTANAGEESGSYFWEGGTTLDDDGTARALRPEQARRFAELLGSLTPDELRRRYDPARMVALEIYPERVWKHDGADPGHLHWLLESFTEVRTFLTKVAAAGDGVIIVVS